MKFTFVVALVTYLDVKVFRFKNVLSKIRIDLTKLETGISVNTNAGHELKLIGIGKNMNFVADNLTYQAVFGFVESFSKGSCCEKRTTTQSDFASVFEENVAKLKTPESCRNDVAVKVLGVKKLCSLETSFFDP